MKLQNVFSIPFYCFITFKINEYNGFLILRFRSNTRNEDSIPNQPEYSQETFYDR